MTAQRTGSVPGKLMVAGEYAVLQPDGLALAVAVGRFVDWTVQPDAGPFQVAVTAFGETKLLSLSPAMPAPQGLPAFAHCAYVQAARAWSVAPAGKLSLVVHGAVGGQKLGLGTSAAVTVAVLVAIAALTDRQPAPDAIAAVARAAHAQAQAGEGSGYDVTTIACGGAVVYARSPDRAEAVAWPADLAAVALYTGQPAPTVDALRRRHAMAAALPRIRAAAANVVDAWRAQSDVLAALAACDAALAYDNPVYAAIVTPSVVTAQQFLLAHGLVPRVSGAGGGDCVLGFGMAAAVDTAAAAWRAAGRLVVAELPRDLAPRPVGHAPESFRGL